MADTIKHTCFSKQRLRESGKLVLGLLSSVILYWKKKVTISSVYSKEDAD